jgi:2-polyprenyl-3-methyl-5-hydroxy-6-metoxy-1,4-benzoquinol methylase
MPECIACSHMMALRFGERVPSHWACRKCGLEFIAPQPDDQALAEIYSASYFTHYQGQSEIDPNAVRSMKRATYARQLRRLPAGGNGVQRRLLDCGAATGFLCELAEEMGWKAFAAEFSEFGADACTKLLGRERVYRGDVQRATFAGNSEGGFEAITMFDFIEHVREPLKILSWAREQLVCGGTLLIGTPRTGTFSWHVMGREWFAYTPREHLWFFSSESLKQLLEKSGFHSVEVRSLPKAVTVGYALAHYAKATNYSRVFSPTSRFLSSVLGSGIKRQRLWFYVGDMIVLARA